VNRKILRATALTLLVPSVFLVSTANAVTVNITPLATQGSDYPLTPTTVPTNPLTGVVLGEGSTSLSASIPSTVLSPWTGTQNPNQFGAEYLYVRNDGTITYDLTSAANFGPDYPGADSVTLVWGSPNAGNRLELKVRGLNVATINPGTGAGSAIPLQGGNVFTYLVTISGVVFDELIFSTQTDAFAFASVTVTTVPLPAAVWLFTSALGGLILIGRRRRMLA
jgi:hypothetical protein